VPTVTGFDNVNHVFIEDMPALLESGITQLPGDRFVLPDLDKRAPFRVVCRNYREVDTAIRKDTVRKTNPGERNQNEDNRKEKNIFTIFPCP
jgi:hypothetical protein